MLRFGDFTFDPVTGELARGEVTERLGPQASRVLQLLVERSGDVITREEFRREIWPGTTVEFDQGLNTCIRQLRIALEDDAASPRYIETLPRRGYRFLEPVSAASAEARAAVAPAPVIPQRRIPWRLGLAVIGVLAAGLVAARINQRVNSSR